MRPAVLAIALALMVVSVAGFESVVAKDNPVAVGSLYFCDPSKSGQVCETPVTAGDTVTWSVQSGTHTVTQCTDSTFTSCGGGFASTALNTGQTFTQSFEQAGTSFYRCSFHPGEMRGSIVAAQAVTASPTPVPSAVGSMTPAAVLPQTGSDPGNDSALVPWILAGAVLLAVGAATLVISRRRAV